MKIEDVLKNNVTLKLNNIQLSLLIDSVNAYLNVLDDVKDDCNDEKHLSACDNTIKLLELLRGYLNDKAC